jgi:hypothetical protein
MKIINYAVLAIYSIVFILDFITNDRMNRVVKSENIFAIFLSILIFLTIFISIKNIKAIEGKVGIIILLATIIIRCYFDYF